MRSWARGPTQPNIRQPDREGPRPHGVVGAKREKKLRAVPIGGDRW